MKKKTQEEKEERKVIRLAIVGAPPEKQYEDMVLQWLKENPPNGELDMIIADDGLANLTLADLVYLDLMWDDRPYYLGAQYIRAKDAQQMRKRITEKADYILFFFRSDDNFCRQWINMAKTEGKHGHVFKIS